LMQRIPRFTPVVGSSHEDSTLRQVAWALRGRLADLLFIDGDHTYGGVKSDWEMYSPLVTKGGVVAFHDINDTQFHHDVGCEVDKLWKELEGEKYEFTIHREWGGIGAMVLR
jgi:cephalosporin hydroxylase